MPSNKNFQMHYYWLCNVDDYTQMKDIILITKVWKKKNPLEVRTLYYNLHIQILQGLRGARRNVWSDCQTSSWLKREERWRPGKDQQWGREICSLCLLSIRQAEAGAYHWSPLLLHTKPSRNALQLHDILPQWQRDISETRLSKYRECHSARSRLSNCLPWWVNKMKHY